MTILRTGATRKFSEGWATAFGKKTTKKKAVKRKKKKTTKKSK